MTEEAGQAAGQANTAQQENSAPQAADAAMNTAGQGPSDEANNDGHAQGGTGAGTITATHGAAGPGGAGDVIQTQDQPQQTERSQGFLLNEFHKLIRSALCKKVEEVAEHTYLSAEDAVKAVVEWVKEEAGRMGWTLSDQTANAFASGAILEHKVQNGHIAVTPPAAAA